MEPKDTLGKNDWDRETSVLRNVTRFLLGTCTYSAKLAVQMTKPALY